MAKCLRPCVGHMDFLTSKKSRKKGTHVVFFVVWIPVGSPEKLPNLVAIFSTLTLPTYGGPREIAEVPDSLTYDFNTSPNDVFFQSF